MKITKARYFRHGAAALTAVCPPYSLPHRLAMRHVATVQKLDRVRSLPARATNNGAVEAKIDMERVAKLEGVVRARLIETRDCLRLPIDLLKVRFYASCPVTALPMHKRDQESIVAAGPRGLVIDGKPVHKGQAVGQGMASIRWDPVWTYVQDYAGKAMLTFYEKCWVLETQAGVLAVPYTQSQESP